MAKTKKTDINQVAKRILDITIGEKPNIAPVKKQGNPVKKNSKK